MANTQINITENGTTTLATSGCYCDRDIDVIVEVEGNAPAVIEAIEIKENGTYTAPEGIDGYSPITVNVPTGGGEVEPIELTGYQSYSCAGSIASTYIKLYGNTISTNGLGNTDHLFYTYQNESIPFELNYMASSAGLDVSYLFHKSNLRTLPKINSLNPNNMQYMFADNQYLREIPESFFNNFNWDFFENTTSLYTGNASAMFNACYSLRKLPTNVFSHMNKNAYLSYTYFYNGFFNCYVLDELVDMPVPYTGTWTSNAFGSTFTGCYRIKNLTFEMPGGKPVEVKWKNQTISLNTLGSVGSITNVINYNSGITADKEVKDDTTYQALKNDNDWFTVKKEYSRYNHDSAVATINSLPDTSAYLATAGGTNTITFRKGAGSLTDGGAIDNLTEEEIAVATAKGWTVTMS